MNNTPRQMRYAARQFDHARPHPKNTHRQPPHALISDWETGKATPRQPRLRELLEALKQPPATGNGTHHWFAARECDFGPRLRAWRKSRGLRQVDACAVLGLQRDQALICDYERGKATPRGPRMERILAIISETGVRP